MSKPADPRRPNILVIVSDDQGPWAMRCAGTPELITPTLDRMAADGMRFENCFCASPVCSPARASLMTGRMPSAHGVHDWLKSGNIHVEDGVTWSGRDRPIEYLAGITAFTDVLAASGYVCGMSGKWHLGASATPQKSYSYWCAHSLGGDSYTRYFVFDNEPQMTLQTQYVTDFFTDRALAFLDWHARGEEPFCLSVNYTAPHAPWRQEEQPPDIWRLYDGCEFESVPRRPPHPWGGWNPTPDARRTTLQGYATTITAMDAAIGRLLGRLDALGVADRTIVLFVGDNGYSLGHHGIMGKGNGTYPLNMFEESVRVPFIARWPGHIPAGSVRRELVSHYDFMPTLFDCVGIRHPVTDGLPGRSFAGLLRGGSGGQEAVVVCDEYGPVRMIREREWKYVHRFPDGPCELYYLPEDPGEDRNLAGNPDHAATEARLRDQLHEWFRKYSDPALDGAGLPVTGMGQIGRMGAAGGEPAFAPRPEGRS